MYGLRNKSAIFKLKRPETRIGRHNSNHVVLTKSLKVSRFHAVINYLNGTPLIKDISEWGVFLNSTPIGKNRWAELKLGDVLALGALKVEDGGHILEVVSWEAEDKAPIPDCKIETVDMTQEDSDPDEVISISDEESKVYEEGCAQSQVSVVNLVTETITVTNSIEVTVISDAEDEVEALPTSSREVELAAPVCDASDIDELPPTEEVKFVDCAALEYKFNDVSTMKEDEEKFTDVTSTMNGLLLQNSSKLSENLLELPQSFQSILNYTSEEDNSNSFDNPISSLVNEDSEDCADKSQSALDDADLYKSPLSVFSENCSESNNNDDSDSESSDLSAISNKTPAPIIHRTLLTNKVAKIAVIAPLPNKSAVKRRRRIRSDSPDTIFHRLTNAERGQKSPVSPKSPSGTRESHKSSPFKSDKKKTKDPSRDKQDKASKNDAMKQKRERLKALCPGLPVRVKRDPSTRPQPKVKITDRNRGDFLTKLEAKPVPRSPAKPVCDPKSDEGTSDEQTTTAKSYDKPNIVASSEPTTPASIVQQQAESRPTPTTEKHVQSLQSIDEILDGIEIPVASVVRDNFSDAVPPSKSETTIEVVVDFSKHRPPPPPPPPPPPLPADYRSKSSGGGSILKKLSETQSSSERKRVRFPSELVTSRVDINLGAPRSPPKVKKKCLGPPNCFDCGEDCLSRKLAQKTQSLLVTCYNCSRDGHSARECPRPPRCFNCKEFGHKGNKCPLPDVRKTEQMQRDPRLKNGVRKTNRWSDADKFSG